MENSKGVTIILLNGTSSAGKTTLAKALQKVMDVPYLHVPVDSFEDMIPGSDKFGEPGSGSWQPIFNRVISGFHHSLAALANTGSNLIVDHLLVQGVEPHNWLEECLDQVAPFTVYLVGVHCPLEELRRRETARGDRGIGLAERQLSQVHQHGVYDLEVDTSLLSPEECAILIKKRVELGPAPTALAAVRQTLKGQPVDVNRKAQ
jgi:chloramphenicol 3-O phosphotransferase